MSRESRKTDHINFALELGDGPVETGFGDIQFLHNCLPETNLQKVNLTSAIDEITLTHPIIINAITGGTEDTGKINGALAQVAAQTGCAMAVGSQYGVIGKKFFDPSFTIVRKNNPDGVIFANLGAYADLEMANRAVDMLEAQALQIHLNVAQELVMDEGDRNFAGYLHNIETIVNSLPVPVIVKETGCGIAKEQAEQLLACGVKIIDVGGAGGTNFPAIEAARKNYAEEHLINWGIPTALSLLEVTSVCKMRASIIATGGIRNAMDVSKAFALGASAVGMSGNILDLMINEGVEATVKYLQALLNDVKKVMVLTGSTSINDLQKVPLLFSGKLFHYLSCRGCDLNVLSKRR